MEETHINNWYSFPQLESPDCVKTVEDKFQKQGYSRTHIYFICPIYPCNAEGCCNMNMVRQKRNQVTQLYIQRKRLYEKNNQTKLSGMPPFQFFSEGYDMDDTLMDEEQGLDYVAARYVPVFRGYDKIMTHMISYHTQEQLTKWGYSREFMIKLLLLFYNNQ